MPGCRTTHPEDYEVDGIVRRFLMNSGRIPLQSPGFDCGLRRQIKDYARQLVIFLRQNRRHLTSIPSLFDN